MIPVMCLIPSMWPQNVKPLLYDKAFLYMKELMHVYKSEVGKEGKNKKVCKNHTIHKTFNLYTNLLDQLDILSQRSGKNSELTSLCIRNSQIYCWNGTFCIITIILNETGLMLPSLLYNGDCNREET